MMKNKLINHLQNLRHGEASPRPEWVEKNRSLLLAQIKNTLPDGVARSVPLSDQLWSAMALFLPRQVVYTVVRPLAVLVMVSLLGLSGWVATSSASNTALPGDTLYPVKIALEKTKVALAETVGNDNARAQAHITYSENRVTDIKRITVSTDPDKNWHIAEAVSNLKEGVVRVNDSLNQHLSGDTIKDAKKNTDQIKSALQEVSDNLDTASTTNADLSKELTATTNLAKDTGVKAVEVFVQKVDDQSVSPEAAKVVLNDAITIIVNDVDSSKATQASVASSTVEMKSASAKVDKKISEAQVLVATDQLSAAVDKIKEVNNDTKSIVVESSNVVVSTSTSPASKPSATSTASKILGTPMISAVVSGTVAVPPGVPFSTTTTLSGSSSTKN